MDLCTRSNQSVQQFLCGYKTSYRCIASRAQVLRRVKVIFRRVSACRPPSRRLRPRKHLPTFTFPVTYARGPPPPPAAQLINSLTSTRPSTMSWIIKLLKYQRRPQIPASASFTHIKVERCIWHFREHRNLSRVNWSSATEQLFGWNSISPMSPHKCKLLFVCPSQTRHSVDFRIKCIYHFDYWMAAS